MARLPGYGVPGQPAYFPPRHVGGNQSLETEAEDVSTVDSRLIVGQRVSQAPNANHAEKMRHRLKTTAGRQLYKLRQQTVEPVIGIIKSGMGFRQFLLRGVNKVCTEWTLVCLACNLRRLHALGAGKILAATG